MCAIERLGPKVTVGARKVIEISEGIKLTIADIRDKGRCTHN